MTALEGEHPDHARTAMPTTAMIVTCEASEMKLAPKVAAAEAFHAVVRKRAVDTSDQEPNEEGSDAVDTSDQEQGRKGSEQA